MTKVVINKCFGGFGLSEEACKLIAELKGVESIEQYTISREDQELIRVVETLGDKAGDRFAELKIVEIPDDVEYRIHEYDGKEHIAEIHRTWG